MEKDWNGERKSTTQAVENLKKEIRRNVKRSNT